MGLESGVCRNQGFTRFIGVTNACLAMKAFRLDISSHRSRQVSAELVRQADLVLMMERRHRDALMAHCDEAANKIKLLTEFALESGDIADPCGGNEQTYQDCAEQLARLIQALSIPLASRDR